MFAYVLHWLDQHVIRTLVLVLLQYIILYASMHSFMTFNIQSINHELAYKISCAATYYLSFTLPHK